MEEIVSRTAYLMAADLIEEFLEDSGKTELHSVDAAGLRAIMGQMRRRGSRQHPFANRSPERIEPTRPLTLKPAAKPKPRPVETPKRPPATKNETHRLYLDAKERIKRLDRAERMARAVADARPRPLSPNNGITPPWIG